MNEINFSILKKPGEGGGLKLKINNKQMKRRVDMANIDDTYQCNNTTEFHSPRLQSSGVDELVQRVKYL